MPKHRAFITYHHAYDQAYKEELLRQNALHNVFTDMSVATGDIEDTLEDQAIRAKIRDEYLRDSTVTILLVGQETRNRKHIDWELYSSMIDGSVNKRSGILVVNLPHIVQDSTYITAAHSNEKQTIHQSIGSWVSINERAEYERRYPYMPPRIIDNLLHNNAKISVVNWEHINNMPASLGLLIDNAYAHRENNIYDLSRAMRRQDG